MAEGFRHRFVAETESQRGGLPGLGEVLPRITAQFTLEGALGVIVIGASRLSVIERRYGAEAHRRAMDDLGKLVVEIVGDRIGINDLIVSGETGRNEIVVVIFREPIEADFYKREIPELRRALLGGLEKRGNRVGYP